MSETIKVKANERPKYAGQRHRGPGGPVPRQAPGGFGPLALFSTAL